MTRKSTQPKPDPAGAVVSGADEPLKLRLGCCSGIRFMEGACEMIGACDSGSDCRTRNVCCKGRRIRFRDPDPCL